MTRRNYALALGLAILALTLVAWWVGQTRAETEPEAAVAARPTLADPSPSRAARRARARPTLEREAKAAVTGTVRDGEGRPIAGAQVCSWPHWGDAEGLRAPPRCTTSEADGRYRLDGLLPVRALIGAEARGYLPQQWTERLEHTRSLTAELRPGQTRAGIDFVLREGGVAITGVVRDISGGVIEGAQVWATTDDWMGLSRSTTLTDVEGRFDAWVAPGSVLVHADADGYAESERKSAAPHSNLELVLTPESVLVGRVVLAGTDEPVAGVLVTAVAASVDDVVTRSDDAGRFALRKLEPGIYDVHARAEELYGEAPEQTHVGLAETSAEIVVELHPARLVTGRVVFADSEERPCSIGNVVLTHRQDPRDDHWLEIRPGGEVEGLGLLPGSYAVQVHCEAALSEAEYPDVELADASATGLVWEVREGQAITGEVVDTHGRGIAGARVFARRLTDADEPRAQQVQQLSEETLADGEFRLAGLLPGRYEVLSFADDFARQPEPITLALEPGVDRHDLRIEMPADGTVSGVVRDARGDPVTDVQVRASGLDRRSWKFARTDDGGRFTLVHVPPGEVRVTAAEGLADLRSPGTRDDDTQGVVAQVVADETVEVELIVAARTAQLRGRVLDSSGAPVTDAFVSHQRMSDSAAATASEGKRSLRWGFDARPVLTDVDGRFTIDGVSEEATYAIGAFRKGGGEALVDGVHPGESVELTLVDTGSIAGKLVVVGGPPPERAKLTLVEPLEGVHRSDDLFRTRGEFRFAELPPGRYRLVVDSSAGSAQLDGIELEPGGVVKDLVVTLVPRVTVRGRLVDLETREPIAGMVTSIRARKTGWDIRADEPSGPHISDSAGRFEIADAQTGKVQLMLWPRDFSGDGRYSWLFLPLTLASDQGVVELGDVELVGKRIVGRAKPGDLGFTLATGEPDADEEDWLATVAVVRPGGPAEAAGLVVGDVIETVDGHDIRGANRHRFYTLSAVAPGTRVTLGLADKPAVTITAGKPIE